MTASIMFSTLIIDSLLRNFPKADPKLSLNVEQRVPLSLSRQWGLVRSSRHTI